ncbi:hypothetical protein cypCar_00028887 [Cyprinus carpio]|nr:hypothetical protein cypCar_00028887 [Cyprinus carpio]
MLSDVVDEIAVQNPSCKGLEPLFISGSRFCNKLGGGLSAGISTMTLQSKSATLAGLEEEGFPIIQQITDSSQTSKPRLE